MLKNICMAKSPESRSQRYKPHRSVRIREQLAVQADLLAARLAHDNLTQVVNDALREKLEREGLWPPPPHASADPE